MNIQGRLMRTFYGFGHRPRMTKIYKELGTTLTIDSELLDGAGDEAHTLKKHQGKRGWSATGTTIMDFDMFYKFWVMLRVQNPQIRFAGDYDGDRISLSGEAVFTNLRISSGTKGRVTVSWTCVGTGKPVLQLIRKDE